MKKKSIYASAGLHVAVFLAATISLPFLKRDFVIPQPISVEMVAIDKITQTDKVAPVSKPPEKKEEKKEENKPPPAAKNASDDAVAPVKREKPKEEEKKKAEKKEEKKETVDKNAPPDKKKKDDKKKKVMEEEKSKPKKDFSSVLKNLADEKGASADKQPDLNPAEKKSSSSSGINAPLGPRMTISEEDALRRQLEGCWNVPIGAKDAENMVVEIFMVINPDRTLQSARVVDMGRYNADTFFRAAADSAMRAVRSPNCSPFELPPDKYDTWRETTVTFRPSDMF